MQLIDTHCHLTFKPLADDIDGVLERSSQAGVSDWITIGTDIEHSRKAVELAGRFDHIYATVGIHPHDAKEATDEMFDELEQLARHPKVVAIGETGLDFHYNFSKQPAQKQVFARHLQLSRALGLPVVVHSRNAFDETMDSLDSFSPELEKVVFHCFSESARQAQCVLDRGFFLSFTGVVTFKNAESVRQAVAEVPLDRLMLETDCPYMSPEPMRKQKVNEPALMIHTAECLAGLRQIELPDFAQAVTQTSRTFFNLPPL